MLPPYLSTAHRLRIYRAMRRKSQAWLGEQVGLSQSSIARFEDPNYPSTPTRDQLIRLARALQVTIHDLESHLQETPV
jgi:transcriptional regulator with XRE-family HTH domain